MRGGYSDRSRQLLGVRRPAYTQLEEGDGKVGGHPAKTPGVERR